MPTTIVELRTAKAILRQKCDREEFGPNPDKGLVLAMKLAEASLSKQIFDLVNKQEEKQSMAYFIEGDDAEGYVIIKPNGQRITTCPCCDKRITTRPIAQILANNLFKLDHITDELKGNN